MLWIPSILLIHLIVTSINCLKIKLPHINYLLKDSIITDVKLRLIREVMKSIKSVQNIEDLTDDCYWCLDRSFFALDKDVHTKNEELLANYYYTKVLLDSSTNLNDLSSFPNCFNEEHEFDFSEEEIKPENPLYVTIFIDYRKNHLENFRNNLQTTSILVGICFVDGCNYNDIRLLTEEVLELLNLTKSNNTLEIFLLKEENYEPNKTDLFLKLIPINIIFLHIFIVIFHNALALLFNHLKKICCNKRKNKKIIIKIGENNEEEINNSKKSLISNNSLINQNQSVYNYLNALFNVENNFEFLFNSNTNEEIINNDSGLSYMNGIKGISIVTLIFGFMFLDLFNSPITKKSLDNFYLIMRNPLFFLFYFGIKYSPKLLLCSSGFSLVFKFMCYLDDKIQTEKELISEQVKEEQFKLNNNSDKNSLNSKKSDDKNEDSDSNDNIKNALIKRKNMSIPFKYYFLFFANQINKYFLYILIVFFILYSLYDFSVFFIGIGPLWNFFKNKMIDTSTETESLIPALFCLQGNFYFKYDIDSLFTYYFLIYQEVMFFIISSIIIFIGYRFNLRIDRFILVIIFILFIFRIFYYYLSDNLNVRDYFDLTNYAGFYHSPIYNYLYYCIGIYFGLLNYVIQKGYSYIDCEKQKKMYLIGFSKLLNILRKKSKYLFYVLGNIFLVLILFFSFSQSLLLYYVRSIKGLDDDNIEEYSNILKAYHDDVLTSIIMLLDTDIVILLVNLMTLFFYLKGEGMVNDFLNLNFFAIFNKIYFSFLLTINPIIFYVFYMTESSINFSMQNCYLYSFACGILIFIFSVFLYAIFELPYKKVIKLFLKKFQIKVGEKRLDFIEKQILVFKKDENNEEPEQQKSDSDDEGNKSLFSEDDNLNEKDKNDSDSED